MSHLERAYALQNVGEAQSLYNDWATTYDHDMQTYQYVAPALASEQLQNLFASPALLENAEILDAGCGTGLVGIELIKVGARNIDGVDLSPGMLEVAGKTGAYRSLKEADLSEILPQADGSYDAITCIGTLTKTHVGPAAIAEFVRITKLGGFIVATILDSIYESLGYKAQVHSLVSKGKVKLCADDTKIYQIGDGVQARLVILQVVE